MRQALVEPGCTPGPGDWSESHITLGSNRTFVHRGQEYVIGENIPLAVAHLICKAQWIEASDRLDYAHKLFVAWMQHSEMREESDEILQGTRPPGISLKTTNTVLRCVGFVLVVGVNVDGDGKVTGDKTRLWIERSRRYEHRRWGGQR